ncbi:hypothetical protein Taro_035346 [Colocasia esculenta]|uniref:malate dehydrogenase n=1 Tax=Colocasia esculenta TaxID=4460 RepID=A0A843W6E1_COLES|nr:hypothetical protein [Colocasia esculenta]
MSPLVSTLHLYDIANVRGVAEDLSHCNTPSQVLGFHGSEELANSLKGADVVVIPAGIPRKPGMTRDDLFSTNANIVKSLVEAVADNARDAFIHIISNPLNSTVPIAAEVLKQKGVYDPKKLFGITTLDVVRANTFVALKKNLRLIDVDVPVVGGHDGITILPLLSKTRPSVSFTDEEVEELTARIQNAGTMVVEAKAGAGSATLSMAYAGARFVESSLRALDGDGDVYECAYIQSELTELPFFASRVKLGRKGVEAVISADLQGVTEYEVKALEALKPELKASIDKGVVSPQNGGNSTHLDRHLFLGSLGQSMSWVAELSRRTSYQNVGSRATRSRQSRADSRRRSPPIDVNIALAGANNDVPAPAIAAQATALEMAELRGQIQQLTGVCLALQAQLVGPPAPAVPLPRERQADSSHRRSRVLSAPQDQQADSPRRSHRAPSEERAPERRGHSLHRSVVSPGPSRSVVGANSHESARGRKASADDDLDFRSPFSREILEARVSPKLPLPTIAPYDGTTDPADHIHGFESHIVFHGASDAAKCRAFPATLKKTARAWFETLPAGSISSFRQLKKSFRDNFLGGRSQPRMAACLLALHQKKDEALWDFVKGFRTEALRISRLDVPLETSALIQGTHDGFLQRTLGVQQPATLAELLSIAQRHVACEENLAAGRAEQGEQSDKKRPSDNGSDRDRKKGRRNGDSPYCPRPFTNYTPLTVAPE